MATKYVNETNAGKSISAYVILNKKGKCVGKVTAYFGESSVLVNVFSDIDGFQSARKSGYGYDKFTAALDGLKMDGVELYDHSSRADATDRALKAIKKMSHTLAIEYAEKRGMRVANWDNDKKQYTSVFMEGGLDRLKSFGYKVIQAI